MPACTYKGGNLYRQSIVASSMSSYWCIQHLSHPNATLLAELLSHADAHVTAQRAALFSQHASAMARIARRLTTINGVPASEATQIL